MAGPKQLQNLDVSNRRINSTNVPLEVALLDASGNQVASFGGGTQYTEGDQDASITGTALLFEVDSTANTLGVPNSTKGLPVNIVAGSAAGTEYTDADSTISGPNLTYRDSSGAVRGVASTRSLPVALSAVQAQNLGLANIFGIGGSGQAAMLDSLPVAIASDQSAVPVSGTVRSTNSVGADLVVTFPSSQSIQVKNSTIAGLLASVQQNSTVWEIQASGRIRAQNSTIGDLLASVQQNSSVWQVQPGSTNWPKAAGLSVDSSNVQNVKLDGSTALTIGSIAANAGRINIGSTATDNVVNVSSAVVNVTAFGGSASTFGRGASGAGIPRVTTSEEARTVSFTLDGAPAATAMETDTQLEAAGYTGISWLIKAGTLAATIIPEISIDGGTSWDGIIESRGGIVRSDAAGIAYTNPNSRGAQEVFPGQGTTHFRLRCSSYTSGAADFVITLNKIVSPLALGGLAQSVPFLAPSVWANYTAGKDASGVTAPLELRSTNVGANVMGLVVRQAMQGLLSTCLSSMGNNSTSSTLVSSAAGVRHKVYAYSITSTAQAVNTLSFASSLANPLWQVQMQSLSSGITGANLAVTPPAWLFATEAASPLVFKITGTTGTYHVSFSYFTEA